MSCYLSPTLSPPPRLLCLSRPKTPPAFKPCAAAVTVSDPLVLEIAEKLEDSLPSPPLPLQRLRDASSRSLLSRSWPSIKDEPFRFTDLSFLKLSHIVPAPDPAPPSSAAASAAASPPANLLTIVNGRIVPALSKASLHGGAYVGPLSGLPAGPAYDRVLDLLCSGGGFRDGDLFWDLNGVGAPDVAVIYVPAGAKMASEPVHLRFCSAEASGRGEEGLPVSNPRAVVVVEKGAEVAIVEEHLGLGEGEGRCYWENSVMEVSIGEEGRLSHSYIQRQSPDAVHIKWTLARQVNS